MATKRKSKKKYNTDPRKKIERGEVWQINYKPAQDVAKKIINELEALPAGGNISKMIDHRLRQSYKQEKKKS